MKVLKFPHPALFKVCTPVTVFGTELKVLLDNMYRTMQSNNGIGLAANQVGLEQRMFVMEGPEGRINLVNPIILKRSMVTSLFREGCLSAPGEMIITGSRRDWVEVTYRDANGNNKVGVFKGIHSVCIEHEIEHLDGKSFMDSKTIPKAKRKELAKKWGIKLE
jgi:peptide deformylase